MTTNTTDLAAALNECMPLTIDGETYESAEPFAGVVELISASGGHVMRLKEMSIIGILWAECVRRGWDVMCMYTNERETEFVRICRNREPITTAPGTDSLAFARAFAAAKRAEGGA